jgi:ornithine carbamoyltransferase
MSDKNKTATCVCGNIYYIQKGYWDHQMCVQCLSKQTDIRESITEVCKTLDRLADVLEYRNMTEATDAVIDALERAMLAKKIICGEGEE